MKPAIFAQGFGENKVEGASQEKKARKPRKKVAQNHIEITSVAQ